TPHVSMTQISSCPVAALRHRMSAVPSPLKSRTAAMFQFKSGTSLMNSEYTSVVPFSSHRTFCPVVVLRHTRSAYPSPLRSPIPLITQCGSVIVGRNAEAPTLDPFISQIWFCPVALLRHISVRVQNVHGPVASVASEPVTVTLAFDATAR